MPRTPVTGEVAVSHLPFSPAHEPGVSGKALIGLFSLTAVGRQPDTAPAPPRSQGSAASQTGAGTEALSPGPTTRFASRSAT